MPPEESKPSETVKSTRPSSAEIIVAEHNTAPQNTTPHNTPSPAQAEPSPEQKLESIPKIIQLEMTPKFYQLTKEKLLSGQNAIVRSHVDTYLQWLRGLKPDDIIDAIETNTAFEDAYRKAPFKWRIAIAGARAFLKSSKRYAKEFKKVVNLELALVTLKFENPSAHATIQQYGERGMNYLKQSLKDALVIFGVEKKEVARNA